MRKIISILSIIAILLVLPLSLSAHSGGLDSKGGHWNHSTGEYHYHRKNTANNNKSEYTQSNHTVNNGTNSDLYSDFFDDGEYHSGDYTQFTKTAWGIIICIILLFAMILFCILDKMRITILYCSNICIISFCLAFIFSYSRNYYCISTVILAVINSMLNIVFMIFDDKLIGEKLKSELCNSSFISIGIITLLYTINIAIFYSSSSILNYCLLLIYHIGAMILIYFISALMLFLFFTGVFGTVYSLVQIIKEKVLHK